MPQVLLLACTRKETGRCMVPQVHVRHGVQGPATGPVAACGPGAYRRGTCHTRWTCRLGCNMGPDKFQLVYSLINSAVHQNPPGLRC